jgi:hypothetical protein
MSKWSPVAKTPRSGSLGSGKPVLTPRTVAMFLSLSADRASLAPGARATQVDLPVRAEAGSAENREGTDNARSATGQGEPTLGLPANQGRTQETRDLHFGERHLLAASPPWSRARPAPRGALLEGVPHPAGRRGNSVRFLLRADGVAEDPLCSFLHRALYPPGAPGRGDGPSEFLLG